jgi:hypothetical protein
MLYLQQWVEAQRGAEFGAVGEREEGGVQGAARRLHVELVVEVHLGEGLAALLQLPRALLRV